MGNKQESFVKIAFILVITISVNVSVFASILPIKNDLVKCDAIIVKIEKRIEDGEIFNKLLVSYNFNGNEYVGTIYKNGSKLVALGDVVEVYCNPDKPDQIFEGNKNQTMMILPFLLAVDILTMVFLFEIFKQG